MQTIQWLEERGWYCCRSSASLGLFDVIGLSKRGTLAVQVKSNRLAPKAEREAIGSFVVGKETIKLLFTWIDGDTDPRIHQWMRQNSWVWVELFPWQKEDLRVGRS